MSEMGGHISGVNSPSELSQLGERFYLDKKEKLEKENLGQFVVIDVTKQDYVVDSDKLSALQKAEAKFGQGFFYIVQVGKFQKTTLNFRKRSYAWQI